MKHMKEEALGWPFGSRRRCSTKGECDVVEEGEQPFEGRQHQNQDDGVVEGVEWPFEARQHRIVEIYVVEVVG